MFLQLFVLNIVAISCVITIWALFFLSFVAENDFFLDFLQKKHHLCLDIVIFIIFVHH